MKQEKSLILMTNYYPYYKGEEYIDNEISIASEYFNKILIIPTMVSIDMKQTRKLPRNVDVLNVKVDCSFIGKMKMFILKLPIVMSSEVWKKKDNLRIVDLKKIIYELYYKARVESVYKTIVNDLHFKNFIDMNKNIVLYSYWMHVVASIAVRLKEKVFYDKVLCITRGHRYDMYDYASPCGYIPDREYVFSKMNAIYPCSENGVEYLQDKFPQFSEKIKVQRLGTFYHGRVNCDREPFFTLVSCSGIRNVKRLDKIIEVVSILLLKGINVRWIHLGDGPDFENVQKIAEEKLPEEAFKFIGRLKNKDIYEWYKNNPVSCFINLSDSEGVPVAIMEAMSFGIPIVATDVGGTREIVKNERNGYVIPVDASNDEIVDTIIKIVEINTNEYKSLCEQSYAIWSLKSDAQYLYKLFYERMLKNPV